MSNKEKIAKKNGINDYSETDVQNTKLFIKTR